MDSKPRKFLPILIAVTGLFFVANFCDAATIYSNSSTGSDSTGDGSSGNPYQTFNKAYLAATSGDTLDLTGVFSWASSTEYTSSTSGYNITKNIMLLGHGPASTIIQASTSDNVATRRVFTVAHYVSTTMMNLSIRYGKLTSSGSDGNGAGVLTNGTTTIVNCEVYSNRAAGGYGGGLSSAYWVMSNPTVSSTLTIINSSIHDNMAYYGGGGVYAYTSTTKFLTITNSTIAKNKRTATTGDMEGAGIYLNVSQWEG